MSTLALDHADGLLPGVLHEIAARRPLLAAGRDFAAVACAIVQKEARSFDAQQGFRLRRPQPRLSSCRVDGYAYR